MRFVRAEYLKYKHTMLNRLLLIAPLLTVLFSFFMAGVLNFQSITIYWWYAFLLQGMIAVLCFLSNQAEEISGNRQITFSLPVNLKKVKWAKHLLLIEKLFITEMICMLLIQICPMLLFPGYAVYNFWELFIANIVLVIITMWQIPFCFIIMRFLGKFTAIFINVLLGLLSVIAVGNSGYWILYPYCWSAKEMEVILRIGMSGVFLDTYASYNILHLLAMVLSVLLFFVLAWLDVYLFEKEIRS